MRAVWRMVGPGRPGAPVSGMLGLDAKATPIAESVVPSIWARSVSGGDLGAENLRFETVHAQKHD